MMDKTHYADDETLAHIKELEELIAQQAAMIEQMVGVLDHWLWATINNRELFADMRKHTQAAIKLQPCPEVLNKVRAKSMWQFFSHFVDGRFANIHISEADNYIYRVEKGKC